MNKGTVEGLSQASTPPTHEEDFLRSIRHSNEVFSAFKAQSWGRKMQERLLDSEGKLRSFADWKKEVAPISRHHVGAWLRTEYDTAVIRAHQAAQWLEFERNKDILPNLQWMPTTSPSPEAGHRLFWEKPLILPVDDPFWSEHRPGDRWNCKCSLDATDDAPRPLDPSELTSAKRPEHAPQPGLEGNPAHKGLITDSHPYYPKSCAVCPHYKAKNLKGWIRKKVVGRVKDCHSCPFVSEAMGKAKYEENYKEYQRLKEAPDYRDVEFDSSTGGVKATHIGHKTKSNADRYFTEQLTSNQLEEECVEHFFRKGHKVLLLNELERRANGDTLSALDISVDGIVMDIRSITQMADSYKNALTAKNKQLSKYNSRNDISETSNSLCLYFHEPNMFSEEKIRGTIADYHRLCAEGTKIYREQGQQIKKLYIVINDENGGTIKVYDV